MFKSPAMTSMTRCLWLPTRRMSASVSILPIIVSWSSSGCVRSRGFVVGRGGNGHLIDVQDVHGGGKVLPVEDWRQRAMRPEIDVQIAGDDIDDPVPLAADQTHERLGFHLAHHRQLVVIRLRR